MNPAEHYQRAEQLAKDAYVQHWQEQDNATAHALAAIAQAHATLASVPVDPREVEDLRGKVLMMKDALDRAREDATELADRLAEVENLPEHVASLVARHRTPGEGR